MASIEYNCLKGDFNMNADDFKFIVECAIKAPSGHNTQPWKFENTQDGIHIHPDFSRALPVVDKDNYELYIGLGCALENLLIAASQKSYSYTVQYPETATSCINIVLTKDVKNDIQPDTLFEYINIRQVTKCKYNNQPIPSDSLKQLSTCFNLNGISLLILDGKKNFDKIFKIIIEASNMQFNNNDFVNELVSWCRFSKREAIKTKDGIWSATMGMPGLGRFLGSMIMKNFVSAKSEAKRLTDLLNHTQGLAIFITEKNDPVSWVKIGQAFQRFGLKATMLGISHAHLNMPCEEYELRNILAKELSIESKNPLLLIRYGYAKKMPYSFRRSFEDVVITP